MSEFRRRLLAEKNYERYTIPDDLVLYLPLNRGKEYAKMEYVSKTPIWLSSYITDENFMYDDNLNMYKIKHTNILNQVIGEIKLPFNSSIFDNNSFTYFGIIYIPFAQPNKGHSFCLAGNRNVNIALYYKGENSTGATSNITDYPIGIKIYAGATLTPTYRQYYQGVGSIDNMITRQPGTAIIDFLPSKWVQSGKITIGSTYNNMRLGSEYYVSDYMIFNRALSLDELIAKYKIINNL